MSSNKQMQDIVVMSKQQIDEELLLINKELFNIRFKRVMTEFKNTSRVRFLKKRRARLLTVLNQKFNGSKVSA
jgi:ribosomal protein L29